MPTLTPPFQENNGRALSLRELRLTIAGTPREAVLQKFKELPEAAIRKLQARFYLSTEWGVSFDTIAIALPFYLARRELTDLQAQETGFVEGRSPAGLTC